MSQYSFFQRPQKLFNYIMSVVGIFVDVKVPNY